MASGSPEANACSQQTVASRSACSRSVSTDDGGTDAVSAADGGRRARAMGGRYCVLDHPARLPLRPSQNRKSA